MKPDTNSDNTMLPGKPALTRRSAIIGGISTLASIAISGQSRAPAQSIEIEDTRKPVMQLGLFTDMHYAEKDPVDTRYYRDSLPKFEAAMRTFSEQKVDAIIQLGDLIDAHETIADEEKAISDLAIRLKSSGIPYHCVLGNHCLEKINKRRFAELAGCREGYYYFDVGPLRIVVLDANYRSDGTPYDSGNFNWTDCYVPPPQLDWLNKTLADATGPVIIFTHQRLDPDPYHTISNHEEVRKILSTTGARCVKAVFQGHFHHNSRVILQGIPYIVLRGMIEGPSLKNNAYAILQVFDSGSISLKGHGQQKSYDCEQCEAEASITGDSGLRLQPDYSGRNKKPRPTTGPESRGPIHEQGTSLLA